VQIEWENGEITDEQLSVIAANDPVTCGIYARDYNLLEQPGCKHFNALANWQKKLFRMINQAKLRSFHTAPRYKCGFEVPRNYQHAVKLDKPNGNTKWVDAINVETQVMKDYQVFKDLKVKDIIPYVYKLITVTIVFDVKHNGRHKARLVAGGHLTDVPLNSVYSGVVSLRGLRIFLLISELNELEYGLQT
jgi:hypothetical protein